MCALQDGDEIEETVKNINATAPMLYKLGHLMLGNGLLLLKRKC